MSCWSAECHLLVAAAVVVSASVAAAQEALDLTGEQAAIRAVQAPAGTTDNPLRVVAWVDRSDNTYARDERVRLFVQTNEDAYVTVLNVGPDGATTVLFPNRFQSDNRVRANAVTEVPDPASEVRITVTGATGPELIKVIASSQQVPLFDAAQLAQVGSFQAVRAPADETARNLSVVVASASTAEWDVYDKVLRTVPLRPAGTPAAGRPVPGSAWPSPPFALQVTTDKPLYRTAERITLMVRTGADCHLTLLNTGSGGASRLLFPNRYQQQTLIRAGHTVVGAGVYIVPIGPAGVEHVVAVCRTGEPPPIGALGDFGAGDFLSLDDAGAAARNLAVIHDQAEHQTAIASATFLVVQ